MPRPAAVSRTAGVVIVVSGALYVIARSTGAGWIVVVLCALLALLVAGSLWPALTASRINVEAAAPRDAVVGRPLHVTLRVSGRARNARILLTDPESEWVRADAPCEGRITVRPERRGLLHSCDVQVRVGGPFGFVSWARRRHARLERPVEVAPRPITTRYVPRDVGRGAQETTRVGEGGHDLTRGIREYVQGDPIRLVHWPATARTNAVMVRELEGPRVPRLRVVVDLRGDPDATEVAASRAMGLLLAALDAGVQVELSTAEADGPRDGPVLSAVEGGRRLARAVSGAPGAGTHTDGVEVRRITARGDTP